MKQTALPAWVDAARWYCSLIGEEQAQSVSVFEAPEDDDAESDSLGTLRLRLEPRYRYSPRVRVLDPDGRELGNIRAEGVVPGLNYAMHRDGEPVWRLTVRSIVRKHHALTLSTGETWAIDTPFFWWQPLRGTVRGAPSLLGGVCEHWSTWIMAIEPGRDAIELLASVAFLHRQWSHM